MVDEMNVTARTKNNIHVFKNGKWEPPITVPSEVHERTLRNINKHRKQKSYTGERRKESNIE